MPRAVRSPMPESVIAGWKGRNALHNHDHPNVRDTKIPRRTDSDGIWEWSWAPESPIQLTVGGEVYADQVLELEADAPSALVVLKAEHRVRGRVTDAMTGKPIQAFTVVLSTSPQGLYSLRSRTQSSTARTDSSITLPRYPNTRSAFGSRPCAIALRTVPCSGSVTITPERRISACNRARRSRADRRCRRPACAQGQSSRWRRRRKMRAFGRTDRQQDVHGLLRGGSRSPTPANRGASWRNRTPASSSANSRPIDTMPEHSRCGPMQPSAVNSAMAGKPVQGATILLGNIRGGGNAKPKFDNERTSQGHWPGRAL